MSESTLLAVSGFSGTDYYLYCSTGKKVHLHNAEHDEEALLMAKVICKREDAEIPKAINHSGVM